MRKKALVFILTGLMSLSLLAGCSSFDGDETAMTVGDDVVTADLANFACRYMQAQYETYYEPYIGENMWTTEAEEGQTYEEYVKTNVQATLRVMLLLEQHMADYGIELTDPEKTQIEKSAAQFSDDNTLDAKEKVSGNTETVERFMTLMIEEYKMEDAIMAEVDTEVSDEEAAQKSMNYVRISKTTTDDDGNSVDLSEEELAEAKAMAEELVEETRAGGDFDQLASGMDLNVQVTSFDSESTTPVAEVVEAVDALEKEREVTDVIETEGTYYVAQLTSLFDEEATEEKKDDIIADRQTEYMSEVLEGWEEETDITTNDSVWDEIDFKTLSVSIYVDESDDYTDSIETDDVAEEEEIELDDDDDDYEIIMDDDGEEIIFEDDDDDEE